MIADNEVGLQWDDIALKTFYIVREGIGFSTRINDFDRRVTRQFRVDQALKIFRPSPVARLERRAKRR